MKNLFKIKGAVSALFVIGATLIGSAQALPGCKEFCELYNGDKAKCLGAPRGIMINEKDGKEYVCKPCALKGTACKGEVSRTLEDNKPADRMAPCMGYCGEQKTSAACKAAPIGLIRDSVDGKGKIEFMCQPCSWVAKKCTADVDPSHKPVQDLKHMNEFKDAYKAYEAAHPDEDDKKPAGDAPASDVPPAE